MTSRNNDGSRRAARWGACILALTIGFTAAGCDSLIDVDNPNNVSADDLLNPVAAPSIANGALYTVQYGAFYMMAPHATAADELTWIGSRDAWQELDFGFITSVSNEFLDFAYGPYNQGRWMADNAIALLEAFQADGELATPNDLASAYLYGAYMYSQIAMQFDDFTFSESGTDGSPPIGEANMVGLFDTAVDYTNKGLAIVGGTGADLERNLLAQRAVARHQKAVWGLINPGTSINPGTGITGDPAAAADAAAALAIDGADWRYEWDFSAATAWNSVGWQVNARLELRFGDRYIIAVSDGTVRDTDAANRGIALLDPIDNNGVTVDKWMTPFEEGGQYTTMTVLSAREMHLIIAEEALSRGAIPEFTTAINDLRGLDNLTDWSASPGMPSDRDILIYERQANLIVQGRRLSDLYRFGLFSDNWQSSQPAFTTPGLQFPITKQELDANCHLNPDFECSS